MTSSAGACSSVVRTGSCPSGQQCFKGGCVLAGNVCGAVNPFGLCENDATCNNGVCGGGVVVGPTTQPVVGTGVGASCSALTPCSGTLRCIDAVCRACSITTAACTFLQSLCPAQQLVCGCDMAPGCAADPTRYSFRFVKTIMFFYLMNIFLDLVQALHQVASVRLLIQSVVKVFA